MNKLYTISQYSKKNDIKRQGVYASKIHKAKLVELPVFVEFEGKKIEIEKRKFIVD